METLKVAIISSAVLPTPPYGYGTEIATYWLARELARMGHQVTLYAALRESRLYQGFTARRIPCTYGPAIYDSTQPSGRANCTRASLRGASPAPTAQPYTTTRPRRLSGTATKSISTT